MRAAFSRLRPWISAAFSRLRARISAAFSRLRAAFLRPRTVAADTRNGRAAKKKTAALAYQDCEAAVQILPRRFAASERIAGTTLMEAIVSGLLCCCRQLQLAIERARGASRGVAHLDGSVKCEKHDCCAELLCSSVVRISLRLHLDGRIADGEAIAGGRDCRWEGVLTGGRND